MRFPWFAFLFVTLALVTPSSAPAYQLTATANAYVQELSPNTAYGCTDPYTMYTSSWAGARRRSLVQFPLNQIPSGTQIQSAVLRVWVLVCPWPSSTIRVNPPASAWNECTVTWNTQPGVVSSPQATADWADPGFQFVDVTQLIRRNVQSGYPNYGLKLIAEDTPEQIFELGGKGMIDAWARPTLFVNECPPPAKFFSNWIATTVAPGAVTLSWHVLSYASSYDYEGFATADCSGSPIMSGNTTATSYVWSDIPGGVTYSWHVRGRNNSNPPGCGSDVVGLWSACSTFTTTGACCETSTGACSLTTLAGCVAPRTWNGATACAPNPCLPAEGACCDVLTGACSIRTESGCDGLGVQFKFQGDGVACGPNPCGGVGACCARGTGACMLLSWEECQFFSPYGFLGPGTACSPDSCALNSAAEAGAGDREGVLGATPNPFYASTTLGYRLSAAAPVRLEIFNVGGHKVRSVEAGIMRSGAHSLEWDGRGGDGRAVVPGVYFARLIAGDQTWTRTLLRVR